MFECLMTFSILFLILIVLIISDLREYHQNRSPVSTLQCYLTQGVHNQIDFFRFNIIYMVFMKGRSWK